MAFTVPRTWVAGEMGTAALLNTHLRDNLKYLKGTDGVVTNQGGIIIDNSGGDEYFQVPSLTTVERDALTPANGMWIYNETTAAMNLRVNGAWVAITSQKEFWFPVTYTSGTLTTKGDFPAANLILDTHNAYISLIAQADFSSIVEAELVLIGTTSGTISWDILSDYAANGQTYNTHSESDTSGITGMGLNDLEEEGISGILSSLAAGDYIGINVDDQNSAHDGFVIGVRLRIL